MGGLLCAFLAACGGQSSGGGTVTHTVSVTVSNLQSGTSVVVLDNGGDSLTVSANGTVAFSTPVASGNSYSVTIAAQPTGQICAVSQGSGTVSTFNINVAVTCTPSSYRIGGTVSGLMPGNTLVLTNNDSSSATVNGNGAFDFSSAVSNGSPYSVTVGIQPIGQTCAITNGSGTVSGADVSNVIVDCKPNSYTISAAVLGLASVTGLVLQDNGADNLAVDGSGTYPFQAGIAIGATYSVTISTQPAGHTCIVQNGSGTVGAANVTVSVICPHYVLYATGSGGSAFYIDDTTGSLIAVSGGTCPLAGTAIAVAPNGKFAYVMNGAVSACSIDPVTGALESVAGGSYGVPAQSMAFTPNGNLAFVAGGNVVSSFNVDTSTGALTATAAGSISVPGGAAAIAVDPTGKYAYVLTSMPMNIATYSIDYTTGGLTAVASVLLSDSNGSGALAVSPVSGSVYTTSGPAATTALYACTLDSATGVLSPVAGSPFATLWFPYGLAISPDGRFLYVASQGVNAVVGYSVDSTTGALTELAGSPFAAGFQPDSVVVEPSGHFAYVANSDDTIGIYSIDASTGSLALIKTQQDSMGSAPVSPFAIGSIR